MSVNTSIQRVIKTNSTQDLLQCTIDSGCFLVVDLFFAQNICRGHDDDIVMALAYLSACSRNGHLCIDRLPDDLNPSPQNVLALWSDAETPLERDTILSLHEMICRGMHKLTDQYPICFYGPLVYLQRNWYYENLFLENYHRIVVAQPSVAVEVTAPTDLLPEQQQALLSAASNTMTIITGGPGTGKTYTAARIIKALINGTDEKLNVLVAAPTGKAATNLQRSLDNLDLPVTVQTIHSMLRINKKTTQPASIYADVILIDESSMIDVKLMAWLFSAINDGCRLIFLGDKYQLPPVEAGSIFADLTRCHDNVVELTKCMRTDLEAIIKLSQNVNQGHGSAVINMLHNNNYPEIILFPLENIDDILTQPFLVEGSNYRILSPLRKGFYGVDALNKRIVKRVLAYHSNEDKVSIPIMITKNNYSMGLYNGEIGTMTCRNNPYDIENKRFTPGDVAVFEGGRHYSAMLLPHFEFAYCMSIHKSQGSEFDHIAIVTPPGIEQFGREVFYTAITRARCKIDVYGDENIIMNVVQRSNHRLSGLGHKKKFKELTF